ncbi:hypothetical protein FIBSPDRAFT_1043717 [Athelia psychrophila]|uniref:F-box domain-containing protein n=1 Tax=Athelia psychrophila TaxID=1759441 RepID=A0A166KTW0_9AGAM|nr:hypothetical protein FIBSPDRAFT_1043717 [Fibularhizoctonia sp. CBS 109695]
MHMMVALASNVVWLKVLPSISTLIISSPYCNGGPMEKFLDHLILPDLRQMTLNQPHRSVISLITRSACTLSSLNIETPDKSVILGLLALSHALRELSITFHNVHHWGEMVEDLRLRLGMQLVPMLRSLVVHTSFTPDMSIHMERFADMFQSRWIPDNLSLGSSGIRSTLAHVRVVYSHDIFIPDLVLARLRRFVAEGLDMALLDGLNEDRDQLL